MCIQQKINLQNVCREADGSVYGSKGDFFMKKDEKKDQKVYLQIKTEDIDAYIAHKEKIGHSHMAVRKAKRVLHKLYTFLPEDKMLNREIARQILLTHAGNYSNSTLNSAISAYNGFMKFIGHPGYVMRRLPNEKKIMEKELTNDDYHRLLLAAKQNNLYHGYLFVNTPIGVQDMPSLTVESVVKNEISTGDGKTFSLTSALQKDLMHCAEENQIPFGPIIINRNGHPYDRNGVAYEIRRVRDAADYKEGEITPRNLQKLYEKRIGEIRAQYEPVIEQNYDKLASTEQSIIGWS